MGDSRGEPSSKRSSRVFLVPSPTESGGVIYRPLSPTESDPALYTSSQDNLDGITACEDDSRRHSQYSLSSLVSQFYLPEHPRPSAGGHSHRGSYVAPSTPLSDGSTQCSVSSPYSEVPLCSKPGNRASALSMASTFDFKLPETAYTIERVHVKDDVDMLPRWKFVLHKTCPLLTIAAIATYFLYFLFRFAYTLEAQQKFGRVYVMAWFFIAAEIMVVVPGMFHHIYSLLSFKNRKRQKLRLYGEAAPTIDVMITTCKEDVDVVLDTVRAACNVDYPRERFRVVILDDGGDQELKKAITEMGMDYPNVHYFARVKTPGVPHHAKAGNLIAGTEFVTTLPGGAGEFIAALDADMIPEPEWLRALIGHLLLDPDVALACPPQMFYNVPSSDPLVQSLDAFIHVMEVTKDTCGVAWCTGSGYIIRRSALESIGGWPTGTLAEDTFTSSLLLGAGFKTAYVHEALQWGTVPDSFVGHLKQRTRWTLGTLQSAIKQRFCLYGPLVKKMTLLQRLSGLMFGVDAFSKLFLIVALFTIPVVLISGGTLVAYTNPTELRRQTQLAFISLMFSLIHDWIYFLPSGYRLAQRDSAAMMWMAPYHAITVFRSFILPKWLGGKPMAFSSTGSIKDELNERDALRRAPMWRRLKVIVIDSHAWIHLLYVAFLLAAVGVSTSRAFTRNGDNWHHALIYLLTHAFFPPMLWVVTLTAFMVPLMYAISPPTVPDREELLDRDPKTGVAHPKEERKRQKWGRGSIWYEVLWGVITVYTTAVFLGSLFFVDWKVDFSSVGDNLGFSPS
ncbi:nucleotide-diphospho-sugar transferase [Phyllosticta capitalensis]